MSADAVEADQSSHAKRACYGVSQATSHYNHSQRLQNGIIILTQDTEFVNIKLKNNLVVFCKKPWNLSIFEIPLRNIGKPKE